MNKKYLTSAFITSIALSMGALVGCNSSKVSDDSIYLNNESLNLVLGDTSKLIAYTSGDKYQVTWSSSNTNVVTVNEEGYLEAIMDGTASILATYGTASAACTVSVTSDTYVPTLNFVNDVNASNNVAPNEELNLATYISFNNKEFYDATLSYSLTNSEAGNISNDGIFHASNNLNASTEVTIKANWRNFDSPSLSKTIEINVVTVKNIYLNGGELGAITLYTADHILDQTYLVEQAITNVEANQDGASMEVTSVNVIETDPLHPVVSFEYSSASKTGLIRALRQGHAKLEVVANDKNGAPFTKYFNIDVNIPLYNLEEVVPYFSIEDGLYVDETNTKKSLGDLFPTGSKTITRAVFNGQELTVKDGAILGVISSRSDSMSLAEVTIYNGSMGMNVVLASYTKVISEVSDLVSLFATKGGSTTKEGYYVLHNDIVSSTPVGLPSGYTVTNFAGVFNGEGHKISIHFAHNAVGEDYGLFGRELKGVISSVAFDHCETDNCNGGFIANNANAGAKLEDVYLNVFVNNKFSSGTKWGCLYSTYGYLVVNRVFIYSPTQYSSSYGSGVLGIHRVDARSQDLYIVSKNEIGYKPGYKSYASEAASNADTEFTGTRFILVGTQRTTDLATMRARANTFDNFPSNLWTIDNGIPVFNGCVID